MPVLGAIKRMSANFACRPACLRSLRTVMELPVSKRVHPCTPRSPDPHIMPPWVTAAAAAAASNSRRCRHRSPAAGLRSEALLKT